MFFPFNLKVENQITTQLWTQVRTLIMLATLHPVCHSEP